jgi:hypothetical protein
MNFVEAVGPNSKFGDWAPSKETHEFSVLDFKVH